MGKTSEPLWRIVVVQRGWMESVEPQPFDSRRRLREKTHKSTLVVTIRKGEERRIYNALLRELLKFFKDQVEVRNVVVIVWVKESTIWKEINMKTLSRDEQPQLSSIVEIR